MRSSISILVIGIILAITAAVTACKNPKTSVRQPTDDEATAQLRATQFNQNINSIPREEALAGGQVQGSSPKPAIAKTTGPGAPVSPERLSPVGIPRVMPLSGADSHPMVYDDLTDEQRCIVCEKTKPQILAIEPTARFSRGRPPMFFITNTAAYAHK